MQKRPRSRSAGWFARHGLAAMAGLVWPPVAAALAYGVLLLAALLFHRAVGGPLALPSMIIMAGIYALWVVFAVAWPSVAVAEILITSDGFKPAILRLLTSLILGVLLAMPWALVAAEGKGPGAFTLAATALPAVFFHWLVARGIRTIFRAGQGFRALIGRRWPMPGTRADHGEVH